MSDERDAAAYASDITAARQRLLGFVARCSADDWTARVLEGDPRPVGVVVDHVAHSYEYLASWMREILAGRSPAVNPDVVDELNAHHATQTEQVSQAEAADHLRSSGDAIAALVAGLDQGDLDAGDGRVRRLAEVAIRHANGHRSELEAALAASG
ncbi:MAG TPA: DinB family protein [Streptosporangiaceae bacterium]|nr:DinB family protein [Streptosporangiaceae bacterium]